MKNLLQLIDEEQQANIASSTKIRIADGSLVDIKDGVRGTVVISESKSEIQKKIKTLIFGKSKPNMDDLIHYKKALPTLYRIIEKTENDLKRGKAGKMKVA